MAETPPTVLDRAGADIMGLCAAFGAGSDQPARRSFEIDSTRFGATRSGVEQQDVLQTPFCVLTRFKKDLLSVQPRVLIIPPLSGHFPFLMTDLVLALLPDHDVYVVEWLNARHVPQEAGPFGFEHCIQHIMDIVTHLHGDVCVISICQATVPTLAATALLAQTTPDTAPSALILLAGPIDPLVNSTSVNRLIKSHSLSWYVNFTLSRVPAHYPGANRLVYPAATQFLGLMAYLGRHVEAHGELYAKLMADDGMDPQRHPFHDAYTALMDLPSEVFLDTIRYVFHERALPRHTLTWRGLTVDCKAMSRTALMTIEGALDDVAAPGQTFAAHRLCSNIPDTDRAALVLDTAGHFSTFHGHHLQTRVAPAIRDFIAAHGQSPIL